MSQVPGPSTKSRLYHSVPGWVPDGSLFHIRIRVEIGDLTAPPTSEALLSSVANYQKTQRWWCRIFMLMPDHLHALLSFPREPGMSETVRAWKSYHTRMLGVRWQDGFFDHRLRNEQQADEKFAYILANPVVKGLCPTPDAWPYRWPA